MKRFLVGFSLLFLAGALLVVLVDIHSFLDKSLSGPLRTSILKTAEIVIPLKDRIFGRTLADRLTRLQTTRACQFCDLKNADLKGMDLHGVDLTRANLTGANLTGANLSNVVFYDATLTRTILVKTNLTEALMDGVDLTRLDFTGANMSEANLTGANLTGANLTGVNLADANLRRINLADANLTNADISESNLSGGDLRGAHFVESNLYRANLSKANLTGANLSGANLTSADLTRANLRNVLLNRAFLFDTNMTNATIQKEALNQALLCYMKKFDGTITECVVGEERLLALNMSEKKMQSVLFNESEKPPNIVISHVCIETPHGNSNTSGNLSNQSYRFYVAGHVKACCYGRPGESEIGIYKKFYDDISIRTSSNDIDFGFLTGDIVDEPSKQSWSIVKNQLSELRIDTHMAPGNHDVGLGLDMSKRDLYKYFNGPTYYSFYKHSDLFIVLDTNISAYDIDGDQLQFLKNTIEDNAGKNNNIFVFMHHIIWSNNDRSKRFTEVIPNLGSMKNIVTNYWSSVAPILEQQKNDVYVISGDVGVDTGSELFCNNVNNIKYIASGMGGGVRDNYLIISVIKGTVIIEVVLL